MTEIKRYPNRKLYTKGGYVTLQDVARLLRRSEDVRVVDTKNGRDVTAYTFAQLIAQEAEHGFPSYRAEALASVICAAEIANAERPV